MTAARSAPRSEPAEHDLRASARSGTVVAKAGKDAMGVRLTMQRFAGDSPLAVNSLPQVGLGLISSVPGSRLSTPRDHRDRDEWLPGLRQKLRAKPTKTRQSAGLALQARVVLVMGGSGYGTVKDSWSSAKIIIAAEPRIYA